MKTKIVRALFTIRQDQAKRLTKESNKQLKNKSVLVREAIDLKFPKKGWKEIVFSKTLDKGISS